MEKSVALGVPDRWQYSVRQTWYFLLGRNMVGSLGIAHPLSTAWAELIGWMVFEHVGTRVTVGTCTLGNTVGCVSVTVVEQVSECHVILVQPAWFLMGLTIGLSKRDFKVSSKEFVQSLCVLLSTEIFNEFSKHVCPLLLVTWRCSLCMRRLCLDS